MNTSENLGEKTASYNPSLPSAYLEYATKFEASHFLREAIDFFA